MPFSITGYNKAKVDTLVGAKISPVLPNNATNLLYPATWRTDTSCYNFKPSNLHKARAILKKFAYNSSNMHVAFIGDSALVGYNGSTYVYDDCIPRQFGKAIASAAGRSFTNGIQQAAAANSVSAGDRWVLSGWSVSNFIWSTAAGSATWTSLDAGTSLEFYYGDISANGFTYQIDGAAAVGVTTTGTSTLRKVTVTGLANTTHTLKINSLAGQSIYIYGSRVWNPAVNQIHVHNLAIGGTRAASGTAGQNWSNLSSPSGLGFAAPATLATTGITPDLVVVSLGANDASSNTATASQISTGLTTVRNFYPNTPYIFIRSVPVNGTSAANANALGTAMFALADSLDVPLFDWYDWDAYGNYLTDNLAGADAVHPLGGEQWAIGRHLARQFAGGVLG